MFWAQSTTQGYIRAKTLKELSVREHDKATDPISTAAWVETMARGTDAVAAQLGLAVNHLCPAARRVVGRASPHRAAAA